MHFAVWIAVLQSIFMQLLSACGEREREREKVDAIFDFKVRLALDVFLGLG